MYIITAPLGKICLFGGSGGAAESRWDAARWCSFGAGNENAVVEDEQAATEMRNEKIGIDKMIFF